MSGLYKDRLIFDAADLAESDQVGAHLYAGGTALTQTGGALDVNVTNAISVSIDHTTDSIKIGDGTDFLAVNADGSINVVATATNLDIRDLAFATDSVTAHQGGVWSVGLTDLVADDAADAGGSLQTGTRSIFGPLSALSATNDRADMISDKYRRLIVNNSPNIAILGTSVSLVNTGAVALPPTALDGRMEMEIQNLGPNDIYVGPTGVTTSNGLRVAKGATYTLKLSDAVVIYAIGTSPAASDVRVMEKA